MDQITQVGLIGFGTMGTGIAVVLAASGRSVVVVDTDQERLDRGRAAVESLCDGALRDSSAAEREAVLSRIVATIDLAQVASADLVIEAVTEDFDIKKNVLSSVAGVIGSNVPIASATSAQSITDLAAGLPNPGRIAGLHFFNPAPRHPVVEVIRGLETHEDVVDSLVTFVSTLDKTEAIVVNDSPGFLVTSMLFPYLNDVIQALDDELASAEDLDLALKLGLGYKVGPLEMLDAAGLDVHLQGTSALYAATGDTRYAPPPLLRRMVAAGHLGAKTGHGFRINEPRKDNA
ncbi:3-hydroxyacyl-CoA dehydrogenase family protein [Aeromicrobium sp. Leaf350]|uniref:3-hydroxyacyl-CoA dehydrogenase family protein n=1 Tax=Aeromicrobium sp. Leaf350 TaxID=2876565 RepID=UPI001E5AF5D7|nr:3-hydroxyacyl-CoA dehydrogenase family protein [Aeromicrobium sp. Leaf350]